MIVRVFDTHLSVLFQKYGGPFAPPFTIPVLNATRCHDWTGKFYVCFIFAQTFFFCKDSSSSLLFWHWLLESNDKI